LHLLIATDSFEPKIDGVAATAGILARALAERGHQVSVVAPRGTRDEPGEDYAGGARVYRLPSFPMPMYREVRLAWDFRPLRRATRLTPDAAIVLTTGPVGVMAMRRLPPRTRIVHIYTTDMPAYLQAYRAGFATPAFDRMLRWMGRKSVATLSPTEVIRADLDKRGVSRLGTWGRGVDVELFRPDRASDEMRARLTGGQPERPLVLYVGRLAREKRILDLLEATRQLRHARFAIVGDGPQREELERLFPTDRTVFTGYLRGEPLAQAFASADVFGFPSDTDTFAQVVLQAMASGTPPVVASGTAPAQFVPHEVAGLHAPARSPRLFTEAIARLIDDAPLRARLAEGAVAVARERSWDTLVGELEAVLSGAGGTPDSAGSAGSTDDAPFAPHSPAPRPSA